MNVKRCNRVLVVVRSYQRDVTWRTEGLNDKWAYSVNRSCKCKSRFYDGKARMNSSTL